jgi:hypothetical protein
MPENAQVMTEIQEHQKKPADTRPEALAEAAGLAKETLDSAKAVEAKQVLDNLEKALAHLEAQQLSGAPNLTPKDVLLDLSDLKAQHPDKVFRWVNIKAPGKADRRRLDGYIRLPESVGGRELGGEIAIFVTTRKVFEAREQRIKDLNKARLKAHRAEVERAVESIAKELRDKYGLKVDPSRILVDDE